MALALEGAQSDGVVLVPAEFLEGDDGRVALFSDLLHDLARRAARSRDLRFWKELDLLGSHGCASLAAQC